jgi:hypothetical protein
MGVLPHGWPPWRGTTIADMGFFDDLPPPEPAPPRRHHPWEPPEAELPGIVPIDTLLLARTDQVAVAVTGPAVVVRSALAPHAGRGDEASAQCGTRVFRRTVVVDLLFPKMLPSASLSQGTVFVSRSGTGYQVWEVAH